MDNEALSGPLASGAPLASVTLRSDMKVAEVIEKLLRANAICVDSGDGGVFYVKVGSSALVAGGSALLPEGEGTSLCCISLADLLEAPRQMPLRCLIGDGTENEEECELYTVAPDPYIDRSALSELLSRLPWLVGLLAFLTVSSAILEYFDALLQRHLVIAFYLTALVGCGGNSGSQAASLVLQALATGEIAPTAADIGRVLRKEFLVALGVALALSLGVAARIALFGGSSADTVTVAAAMAVTVLFSVVFGALAPLLLQRAGVDPAKVSGPLLSTVIDIVGVVMACASGQVVEALGGWG